MIWLTEHEPIVCIVISSIFIYSSPSPRWIQRGKIRLPLKQSTWWWGGGGNFTISLQIGSMRQCSRQERDFKDFIYNIICLIIGVKAKVLLVWLKSSGFMSNYTDISWKHQKMTTAVMPQVTNLHHVRKQKCAGLWSEIMIYLHNHKVSIQREGGMAKEPRIIIDKGVGTRSILSLLFLMKTESKERKIPHGDT